VKELSPPKNFKSLYCYCSYLTDAQSHHLSTGHDNKFKNADMHESPMAQYTN